MKVGRAAVAHACFYLYPQIIFECEANYFQFVGFARAQKNAKILIKRYVNEFVINWTFIADIML